MKRTIRLACILAALPFLPTAASASGMSPDAAVFEQSLVEGQKAVLSEAVWNDVPDLSSFVEKLAAGWEKFPPVLPAGGFSLQGEDRILLETGKAVLAARTAEDDGIRSEAFVWIAENIQRPLAFFAEGFPSDAFSGGPDGAVGNFLSRFFLPEGDERDRVVRSPDGFLSGEDRVVGAFSGRRFVPPFEQSLFFWIDDDPHANWGHPTRYVFAKPDLSAFAVLFGNEPIVLERAGETVDMPVLFGPEPPPDEEPDWNGIRDAVDNAFPKDNAVGVRGDPDKSYAILISGGYNRNNNHTRYWGDMSAVYGTLVNKYGFRKDHIKVCMSDGPDTAADLSSGTAYSQSHSSFGSNSPTDLDGDGSADVTYNAKKATIQNVFNLVKSQMSSSDQLFVFVTDHGDMDYDTGVCYMIPWISQTGSAGYSGFISASEFASMLSGFSCPVLVACEFCFSGGFISSVTRQGNRVIATAAGETTSSGDWATSDTAYMYMDPWVYYLVGAFRGVYPSVGTRPYADSSSSCYADSNGDGYVSFAEAGRYAKQQIQSYSYYDEVPQYAESSSGLGDNLFLLKQTSTPTSPQNDSFASATAISGASGSRTASNTGATMQSGEVKPSCQSTVGASVWFTWTAPASGKATFETTGSSFDTVLGIYTGSSVSSLREIGSDDDGAANNCSKVEFTASSGTTYRIAVYGYSDRTGTYILKWSMSGIPVGNLDTFPGISISGASGRMTGNNGSATMQSSEVTPDCQCSVGASHWYTWTAPASGDTIFETEGSSFDTVLGVYTGSSVSSLREIVSDDDSAGDLCSRAQFTASAGTTYRIAVYGYAGKTGNYVLKWSMPAISGSPVYRFYSQRNKGHFFTISESEKQELDWYNPNWRYERVAYRAFTTPVSGTVPLYRFYSQKYKGHFYTTSASEKQRLQASNRNWKYERIAYYVYPSAGSGRVPVYRFWSQRYGHHFYTTSEDEKWTLQTTNPNWKYERIAFYALPESANGIVPALNGAEAEAAEAPATPDAADPSAGNGKKTFSADDCGVFEIGGCKLEISSEPPDVEELGDREEAEELETPFPVALRVPEGATSWEFWNAERGILADGEATAATVGLELPDIGLWHWLRFFGADGATFSSTWMYLSK